MAKKHSRQLLARSCDWIRAHRDTTNHEVPDDLLESWTYSTEQDSEAPSGYQLAVFIFGYMSQKIKSEITPHEKGHSLALSKALSLFQAWQCKLALSELHRHTDLKVSPSALFIFSDDEQVRVWKQ